MVLVTDDWERFMAYCENCRVGCYQSRSVVDGVEVRVQAGRFGFVYVFESKPEMPELFKRIMTFCNLQGYIKVLATESDETFFKESVSVQEVSA